MIYEPGEWSENEMKRLFSFEPEDTYSEDPDVLYSGELIDVENGGIRAYARIDLPGEFSSPPQNEIKSLSEIALEPYSIEGNLFEIRYGKKH